MSAAITPAQQDRVAAYRRRRPPESQSDSQSRPWAEVRGGAHPLDPAAGRSNPVTPQGTSLYPTAPPARVEPPPPAMTPNRAGDGPRRTQDDVVASGGAQQQQSDSHGGYHDMDIRAYIFDLELQNRDLRKQLETAQQDMQLPSAALVSGSDEAKKEFLTNVLTQVESIVEAHRSKANAEIHRYKTEAEQAKSALTQLRSVIQNEGLDLTLAPALISFHRQQKQAADAGKGTEPSPLGINFPPEVDTMLHDVARDVLVKLQTVTDREHLGTTMREAVRSGFQQVLLHFTDELLNASRMKDTQIENLKAEVERLEKESRTAQLAHESKRVELATEHQLELDALQDEVRVLTAASAGTDGLTAAMHEKAFAEYAELLVEARREASNLRAELDLEKNKSAEVCLKLKASLEKRRVAYEQEIVSKAEEVVSQRDRLIGDLEARLRAREAEFAGRDQRSDFGCQAGEPLVHMPEKENFVPAVLAGVQRESRAAAQSSELYEREVWKKTQELLAKYGGAAPGSASRGAGGGMSPSVGVTPRR